MESKKYIITFIKAVDKQYYNSFIDQGEICMNTLKWFRDYEKIDSNIGDCFEGAEFACGHDFTVEFADPITDCKTEEEIREKLNAANWLTIGKGINLRGIDESQNANIFSLYAVISLNNEDFTGYLVPKKFVDEFKNHRFVIILDPIAFISRIRNVISELNKPVKFGLVNYYKLDENIINNLTCFSKPEKYSYQSEFRLIMEDPNAVPRIIQIGSIKEMCMEIDSSKEYVISMFNENQFSIKQK